METPPFLKLLYKFITFRHSSLHIHFISLLLSSSLNLVPSWDILSPLPYLPSLPNTKTSTSTPLPFLSLSPSYGDPSLSFLLNVDLYCISKASILFFYNPMFKPTCARDASINFGALKLIIGQTHPSFQGLECLAGLRWIRHATL